MHALFHELLQVLIGGKCFDDNPVVSRGKTAAISVCRGHILNDDHDDFGTQTDYAPETIRELTGRTRKLEIRTCEPPVIKEATRVTSYGKAAIWWRDVCTADPREDCIYIARSIIKFYDRIDLTLDIYIRCYRCNGRNKHTEVHLFARTNSNERGEEVYKTYDMPDDLCYPVEYRPDDTANYRNVQNYINDKTDYIEDNIYDFADNSCNPFPYRYHHQSYNLDHNPNEPTEHLLQHKHHHLHRLRRQRSS